MQPKSEIAKKRSREEVLAEIRAAFELKVQLANKLLNNIKEHRDEIESSLKNIKHFEIDLVYRFYHQSWDVFIAGDVIKRNKKLFEKLSPTGESLDYQFSSIFETAIQKEFNDSTNKNWGSETQPILEAFWHTKYFLEQMLTSANELETAPEIVPSGWAAVLYLYNLR